VCDLFAVPGAEPDDHASVRGARRRGARLRAGAQVAGTGADALPGAQVQPGGGAAGQHAGRVAVPEGADHGRRHDHQPDEVNKRQKNYRPES
jgi:hypothetical protein